MLLFKGILRSIHLHKDLEEKERNSSLLDPRCMCKSKMLLVKAE